jgi:hypothetical protein
MSSLILPLFLSNQFQVFHSIYLLSAKPMWMAMRYGRIPHMLKTAIKNLALRRYKKSITA